MKTNMGHKHIKEAYQRKGFGAEVLRMEFHISSFKMTCVFVL